MASKALKVGLYAVGALSTGLVALALISDYDMKQMTRAKGHSMESAKMHYSIVRATSMMGKMMRRSLENDCKDAAVVQRVVLNRILRSNQSTELGRRLNLRLCDPSTFRRSVPVSSRDDYAELVSKIEESGANDFLVCHMTGLQRMAETAGTGGERALLPISVEQQTALQQFGEAIVDSVLYEWAPDTFGLLRTSRILFSAAGRRTQSGIAISPSNSDASDAECKEAKYATPQEAWHVADEGHQLYLHLLAALREEDLGAFEAAQTPLLLQMLRLLEDEAVVERLIADLRTGGVDGSVDMDSEDREALSRTWKPLRARADLLQRALQAHAARGHRCGPWVERQRATEPAAASDHGVEGAAWRSTGSLVGDLWPRLGAVMAASASQFGPATAELRRTYLPPEEVLPCYDSVYSGTEGLFGVNVAPFGAGRPLQRPRFFADAVSAQAAGAGGANPEAGPPPADNAKLDQPVPESLPSDLAASAPAQCSFVNEETGLPSDGEPAYLLHPAVAYFEFIPVGSLSEEQPSTLEMQEVVPGCEYELVVTNSSGLLRCRTGDVVRVLGRHNGGAPIVQLAFRRQQSLALSGGELREDVVRACVAAAGVESSAFAFLERADEASAAPALHVELADPAGAEGVQERLDTALQASSESFAAARADGAPPVAVVALPPGAFDAAWLSASRASSLSISQNRSPCVLKDALVVRALQQQREEASDMWARAPSTALEAGMRLMDA